MVSTYLLSTFTIVIVCEKSYLKLNPSTGHQDKIIMNRSTPKGGGEAGIILTLCNNNYDCGLKTFLYRPL